MALAQGYIQPWLPPKRPKEPIYPKGRDPNDDEEDEGPAAVKSPKGKKVPANVAAAKARIPEVTISPDAQPDLKKALEVTCCYQIIVVAYQLISQPRMYFCTSQLFAV